MYISFLYPKYLVIILVVPVFILVHFLSLKSSRRKALSFANFEAISRIRGIDLFSKNISILFLSLLIIFLLIFAMSGMVLHMQRKASSFSFVLAIDTSRSMDARDIEPNRLEASKEIAEEFVDSSPISTRVGIVSFSGNAFIRQDITDNKNIVTESVKSIEKSDIEGTDIYEAVITSTNLLRNEEAKAIVLLSDGQITIGDIEETIKYANDNDIMIHTIAIGTQEGGMTSYGISKLDEDTLKALSYNTNGQFFKATDKATLHDSFINILDLTEKKVSVEFSPYLLLAAILFFILEYILINTRYRTFP